jgi:hypothetical protein
MNTPQGNTSSVSGSADTQASDCVTDALDAARYRALKRRHGYLMVTRLLGERSYSSAMKDAQIDAYADLAIKEVGLHGDAQPDALELLGKLADYFDSFREGGERPDEWLLKEWSDKARAVLAALAKAEAR